MDFGAKLNRLLLDYNLSAYELSKRAGIAEAAISRSEDLGLGSDYGLVRSADSGGQGQPRRDFQSDFCRYWG